MRFLLSTYDIVCLEEVHVQPENLMGFRKWISEFGAKAYASLPSQTPATSVAVNSENTGDDTQAGSVKSRPCVADKAEQATSPRKRPREGAAPRPR